MKIAGLVKSSTVDFPEMLAAVIFTPGCNLDCFYCHNRALLGGNLPLLEMTDVMDFLLRRRHLLDGVVFSGGEPMLQAGLGEMIGQVRRLGYKVKIDTNGTRPQVLRKLLDAGLLDYVAIDCKAPWARYTEFCDCSPEDIEAIKESFKILSNSNLHWEARTTVIPQLSAADLTDMARALPMAPAYILQRFIRPVIHRAEDRFRLDASGFTPAKLVLLAEDLRQYQPNVRVR